MKVAHHHHFQKARRQEVGVENPLCWFFFLSPSTRLIHSYQKRKQTKLGQEAKQTNKQTKQNKQSQM
jgi:hypothetical protein